MRSQRRRRQQFARYAWAAVGVAALIGGVGLWRQRAASGEAGPAGGDLSATLERRPGERLAPASVAVVTASPESVAPSAASSVTPAASSAPLLPRGEPAPSANGESPPDPVLSHGFSVKSRRLLETGRFPDAIAAAQQAIDADPTDAYPYLYWGTALLEMGRRGEARAVFSACTKRATRGPKGDCWQFR